MLFKLDDINSLDAAAIDFGSFNKKEKAPAFDSPGSKIKLSPSQVAIADKLGVPYDAYAKQLARINNS